MTAAALLVAIKAQLERQKRSENEVQFIHNIILEKNNLIEYNV